MALDEEAFIAHLPLLRRVFSALDRTERRRLIDAVLAPRRRRPARLLAGAAEIWPRHQARVIDLLNAGAADDETDERKRRWRWRSVAIRARAAPCPTATAGSRMR